MSNNNDIGMKLRVIGKMIEGGLTNENDVKKADMRIILELPNVTLKELKVITQIQDADHMIAVIPRNKSKHVYYSPCSKKDCSALSAERLFERAVRFWS